MSLDSGRHERRELWWLLVVAAILLGAGLGLRDPWPSDEPRFTLVARWMVEHGQWLFPHRGSELYPDKPPLFMWLQAVLYLVTRSWRVAFLLPSVASGVLCIALVHDLGRRLWSHRAGLLAGYALLVTIQFGYQFRAAQIDPLLTAWVMLACYGLLRHFLLGPHWRWYMAGCFFAGVGVITKGVGVLALLLLLPWAFARARGWRRLPAGTGGWRLVAGLPWLLLPVLAWLLPVLWTTHELGDYTHAAYVHNILYGQTVHRYLAAQGHLNGPLYYFGVMLLNWLPLSLALPWALPAWWRRLRRGDARFLLLLAWVVLVVLFFSWSTGKRGVYILPALPIFALALAPLLPGLLRRPSVRRLLLGVTACLAGVLLLVGLAGQFLAIPALEDLEARLEPGVWLLPLAMGAIGLAVVAVTRLRRAPLGWFGFIAAVWLVYGLAGYPLLNDDRSAREVMVAARTAVGPDVTLGLVAWKEQNLLQAQGPVVEFGFLRPWPEQFAEAAAWLAADPAQRRLFIREAAMGSCVRRELARDLGRSNRREWWLVPAEAVVPGCVPDVPGPSGSP